MGTAQTTKKEVLKTRETAKRMISNARSLVVGFHALEEFLDTTDFYGRVRWNAKEQRHIVEREVADLIALARADYPDQEIEITVVVHVPQPAGKDTDRQGGNGDG
jgi:hypothetical protein